MTEFKDIAKLLSDTYLDQIDPSRTLNPAFRMPVQHLMANGYEIRAKTATSVTCSSLASSQTTR